MYCGDETGGIVVDIGHHLCRFGYAGQDLPAAVFPASVGVLPSAAQAPAAEAGGAGAGVPPSAAAVPPQPPFIAGGPAFSRYTPGLDVRSPYHDGHVKDWDALEQLWEYGLTNMMHVNVKDHPLMIADNTLSASQEPQREKLVEILFEKFQPMALYLARSSVLSAFSAGRSTALVVDLGAGGTSVTPVFEGHSLKRASVYSALGGHRLDDELVKLLAEPARPRYTFSKKANPAGGWVITDHPMETFPDSYKSFLRRALGREVKESVCSVSPVPLRYVRASAAEAEMFEAYELPDGTSLQVKDIKFALPELLFDPTPIATPALPLLPLSTMVHDCLKASDSELRKELAGNVMVVGGGSVMPNFSQRLSNELGSLIPLGFKARVLEAGVLDRRFSAFVGGSILASLGTFQQLWVSKAEYDDEGPGCVDRHCP